MPPAEHQKAVTYTTYLKVEELLSLQEPLSDGPEHDELLFITIHQVYELWFQQILHELSALQPALEKGDTHRSLALLGRVRSILKTCVQQIDVLETMTPLQFQSFRSRLSSASGFQSAQFREVEAVLGRRDHAGEGAKEGTGMKMAEHLVPGSLARNRVEADGQAQCLGLCPPVLPRSRTRDATRGSRARCEYTVGGEGRCASGLGVPSPHRSRVGDGL